MSAEYATPDTLPLYTNPKQRALSTPEGVDLNIEIASFGSRILAFIIDSICIYGTIIGFSIAVALMATGRVGENPMQFLSAIWLLVVFVLRNFWFILFEMGARGATPGKRLLKLRVVARDGGRLEASSVVARNLMRDVEVFLPLMFVFSLASFSGYTVLAFGWTLMFMLFPLFNKDRMRAGDLLGGTWVIRATRTKMHHDLNDDSAQIAQSYAFTPEQLMAYGAFEVQTLEGLLRGKNKKSIAKVADVVRGKIGWIDNTTTYNYSDRVFLQAYYTAARAHLEKNMLFGKKRRDKHDVS